MRILRALAALLVLLAVVVGAPILLWKLGSGLLPTGIPSLAQVWDTLTSRDTGQIFMGALVVAGLLAWAIFTLCVLAELAQRLTGRRWPRIRLLRVPQSAAAALVSAVLAGSVALGAAGPAAAATTGPDLHQALTAATTATLTVSAPAAAGITAASTAPAAPAPEVSTQQTDWSGPVWVVARYDTLWGIAERTLGDGLRYQEIVDLNIGVPQADGTSIHDASTSLEIGWQLRLPNDATTSQPTQVTVHPGDTLSQIAADRLGSASRYPELAALNSLPNPDLIEVGQSIELPVPEPTATIVQAPDAAPTDPAPNPTTQVGQNASAPADPSPAADPAASAPSPDAAPTHAPAPSTTASTPTTAAGTGPSQASAPATPTPSAAGPSDAEADRDQTSAALAAATVIGFSAVLAAAAWIGLRAARRRKGRRRPTGQYPVPTSLPAARMERQIRDRAATRDVLWMDTALRSAAHLTANRAPEDLPDVTCAWLSDQELILQLAAPAAAPAPFTAAGTTWSLPVGTTLPPWDEESDPAAPFPLLTSLGELDGETLLVDLERLGAVSIAGDPNRTRDLLVHLAVELATNTWSDHLQLTLVGWGAELVTLNPDRIRHRPALDEVTTLVHGRVQDTRQTLDDLQTTVLADRLIDQGAGDWTPEVWLIDAGDQADLTGLEEILAEVGVAGRATVAVIARSDHFTAAGGATINIDEKGMLTLPPVLGDLRVQAAAAGPETVERLLELFESAGRFTRPGPMLGPDPWARGMTTDGALNAVELFADLVVDDHLKAGDLFADAGQKPSANESTEDDTTQVPPDPDASSTAGNDDLVGQETGRVLPLHPPPAPPSPAATAVLNSTLADDEELDADVAEWFASTPRRPRVAVLGPPTVTACGTPPTGRLARMTEMAVYLGTHREVDADKFVTDLWAHDATVKAVSRRSDVSRVRAWLGVDDQGRKYLPEARSKPYRLHRLLDLDLFRRLRKRADARAGAGDSAGAQRDLLTALMLVRGPVMDQASPDAYGWLMVSDPAGVQQAGLMVIATAHQLVDSALADGDLDLARAAADIAHRVDPSEDQPLCDLLRISHRAGNDLDARSWAQLLLQSNGVETPEDLPNLDSYLAVNEVFPRGLRAAAASTG